MTYQPLMTKAEILLSTHFGAAVHLHLEKVFQSRFSLALRCRLATQAAAAPASVIVKQTLPVSGLPNHEQYTLLNEWAASIFLNRVPHDPPLAPQVYAGNAEQHLLILEDLGEGTGPNTAELLQGDNPDAAEQGLMAHVALLGQLHAKTVGRSDEYAMLRKALGPVEPAKPLYQDPWSNARRGALQPDEIDRAITAYCTTVRQLGVRLPQGIDVEIAAVTVAVEDEPGPWLAFCKGDQNLGSDYIRCGPQLRLYDFGSSGYRHALIEGMPGHMTWGCYGGIPAQLLPKMEAAYQTALSAGCPIAADVSQYYRAQVAAGARWHIFHVIWRLPEALQAEKPNGPSTRRRLCLAWLAAFATLAEEYGQQIRLGACARQLYTELRQRWALAPTPSLYPAFR